MYPVITNLQMLSPEKYACFRKMTVNSAKRISVAINSPEWILIPDIKHPQQLH